MGRDRHQQQHQGIYTAPMDHSYRAAMTGDNGSKASRRPGFAAAYIPPDPEPLPAPQEDAASRIFAFVEDLFFLAKIQETGRKMNVKVEFVKTEKDLTERLKNGEEKPSLIILDLNNANAKPLTLIPKLKSKLKKGTSIIGFLSHVQGDLKQKAHEVGCDMVLPRSAFSKNLPQLLRRHGATDDESNATQEGS
jgi:CheY-like chemotaxis protein